MLRRRPSVARSTDRRGPIDDQTIGWALFSPVEAGGAGCRIEEDGKRTCPAIDWTTLQPSATERFEIGASHGQWALTVLDTGRNSAGSEIRNCASCPTGGAHTNQWYVRVRDDAPAVLCASSPSRLLWISMVLFHSITWIALVPKVLVIWRGDERVNPRLIAGAHYAAWLVVSGIVAWVVLR